MDWKPQRGSQMAFHECSAFEMLYGGSAGGGKSESLMIEATRFTDNPTYRAILFRRSFPELQSTLVPRAYDIFSGMATARNQGLKWTFKSGATIEMAHLYREEDKEKHKSSEYDYIAFDELTSFTESSYNYLFSRCRGKNKDILRRMRAGSNPTGIGWSWVKTRFVTPDLELVEPIEEVPYQFACGWKYRGRTYMDFDSLPEGFDGKGESVFSDETYTIYKEKKSGLTRAFIPALLWGNEFIVKNDPDYILRLKSLDEYQKEALLNGSWDYPEGQFFDFNIHRHVAELFEIPDFWERYVSIDYGYTAPMCALWFALSPEGKIYVYRELYARKLSTDEQAKFILDMTGDEKINWFTCDPSMMARQGTGESHADVYSRHGVYLSASSNKRVPGWALVHEYLSNGLFQIFPSCPNLIREFGSAVRARSNPEDLATAENDHCFAPDTLVYTTKGEIPIKDLVGKEGFLYSRNGRVCRFKNVRSTRTDCEVITFLFDDLQELTVTPDHLLLHELGVWKEAQLYNIGDLIQSAMYGCRNTWSQKTKVQWSDVLSLWKLFQQFFNKKTTSSSGLGISQWFNSKRISHSSQRSQQEKQSNIQSRTQKPKGSFGRTHDTRAKKTNERVDRTNPSSCKQVAWVKRGKGVARVTWKGSMGKQKAHYQKLRTLPQRFFDFVIFRKCQILPSKLQNERQTKKIIGITRGRAKITFNLDVEETQCLLAGGVIAHNSLDALRYFLLTLKGQHSNAPKEASEGLPDWWSKLQFKKKQRKLALENLL